MKIAVECPSCGKKQEAEKGLYNYPCSECKTILAICPLDNCNHVWIPRKEYPRECPWCKRYTGWKK